MDDHRRSGRSARRRCALLLKKTPPRVLATAPPNSAGATPSFFDFMVGATPFHAKKPTRIVARSLPRRENIKPRGYALILGIFMAFAFLLSLLRQMFSVHTEPKAKASSYKPPKRIETPPACNISGNRPNGHQCPADGFWYDCTCSECIRLRDCPSHPHLFTCACPTGREKGAIYDPFFERETCLPFSDQLKVYSYCDQEWSWGARVCTALRDFAPKHFCFHGFRLDADIEIKHVDADRHVQYVLEAYEQFTDAPIVVLQHGIAKADASRERFAEAWSKALLTASFQDLSRDVAKHNFPFLAMPWGADKTQFVTRSSNAIAKPVCESPFAAFNKSCESRYVIVMGTDTFAESHDDVLLASARAGLQLVHVGGEMTYYNGARHPVNALCGKCDTPTRSSKQDYAVCQPLPLAMYGRTACDYYKPLGYVADKELLELLQGAQYVALLRSEEGFEIGGIEALFSGTRPILYDLPIYRNWYGEHAHYISGISLNRTQKVNELLSVLSTPPRQVDDAEMALLHKRFSWQSIVPALFERIRQLVISTTPLPCLRENTSERPMHCLQIADRQRRAAKRRD